ncbi:uncharacterized protein LOC132734972 [Ruditapes philippinarum]|uniref:uncharacterized protein LOC132734972 n=1 Tax=Ruditapes philippinarum TaxID=129788 RepID=UPI00295BD557|nr:uncharacterized protein LOC132734972 [Ruditapes philippinarum]
MISPIHIKGDNNADMSQESNSGGEQTSWPELVGLPSTEAENVIRGIYKNITIQILPENSMVTMDYREDRVRIFTDGEGKVATAPMIG